MPKTTKHLAKHKFKPGQSGNPSGRPKMDPKARVLKELTVQSFRDVIEVVCTGNIGALEAMKDDPNISALQVGIAACMAKAMRDGDYPTIEKIAERIVGKIPDELNLVSKNLNANFNAGLTKEELKEEVKVALAALNSDV